MTAMQEEVPYPHVVAALNEMLNQRTTELAMANARISARDATIADLRQQVERLTNERITLLDQLDQPTAA